MNTGYINAFCESVEDLFASMLNGTVQRAHMTVTPKSLRDGELIAIMGLSGSLYGTVALILSLETTRNMVGALLNCTFDQIDDTVVDGVAEIANIIVGSAKARLALDDGIPLQLGLPTVVRGNEVCISQPTGTIWVDLPFTSSLGPFALRVALRRSRTSNSVIAAGTHALIVDKAETMRKVFTGLLGRADVKHQDYADDVDQAAQMAAAKLYDIVIVCTGSVESVQRLRAAGVAVPIIVVLAESERARAAAAVDAGATECVFKPFEPNALASKIRELLTNHWAKEAALAESAE